MKVNQAKIEEIRQKHNLSLVLLYGSHVSKKTHPKSDVDIAVVRNDDQKKLQLLELINDLSKALKTDRIDLSDLTHADPLLLFSVTNNSQLLAGNPKAYNALQRKAFFRYNNYLPYLEIEDQFVKERIKSYVTA